jgi:ABC-type glycerol-3-phosphate transport system permease component
MTERGRHSWSRIGKVVLHRLAILLLILFILAPIYIMVLISVTPAGVELTGSPQWLPTPTFEHFRAILHNWHSFFSAGEPSSPAELVLPGIRNSLYVAVPVAIANLVIGAPAGYAFARLRFPARHSLALGLLGTQMLPALVLILPFFVLFRILNLVDSLTGIVLGDLAITLPFTIWIVANAVQDVPVELERAARVDGLTWLRSIFQVTLPLARSGLIAGALFAFLVSWNDLLFPLVLITSPTNMMIQPAIAGMYSQITVNLGVMSAATVLAMIPPVIIAVAVLRPLTRGLLSGAVKG